MVFPQEIRITPTELSKSNHLVKSKTRQSLMDVLVKGNELMC